MTKEREHQIELGNEKLTEAERKEGWHFCSEWDGMLVGPNTIEMELCSCFEDEERKKFLKDYVKPRQKRTLKEKLGLFKYMVISTIKGERIP